MKKFGIFVIKPDAVNKHDLGIIRSVLEENGFGNSICFTIEDYCALMRKYREADIIFKQCENAESEIRGCGVALSAYEQLFPRADGLLLLIPLKDISFKDFYEKADPIKREIRKTIEGDRGYYYAFVDYLTEPKLRKMSHEEYKARKEIEKKNINRAYINGIHLEDYECLESNFCLNFMVQHGVINKANMVNLDELIDFLEV